MTPEQQRALARARARKRRAEAEPNGDRGPGAFFNRGLIDGVMAIPDLIDLPRRKVFEPLELEIRNWVRSQQGLDPVSGDEGGYFGSPGELGERLGIPTASEEDRRRFISSRGVAPSEMVARAFRSVGAPVAEEDQPAETGGEKFSETFGNVPGLLMGATPAVSAAARAGGPLASRIADDIARTFSRNPVGATTMELGAGAAAGGGRAAAGEDASPAEQALGELLGGLSFVSLTSAASGAVNLAGKAPGVRVAREILTRVLPFSEQGSFEAASKRVRETVADPDLAAKMITEDSPLTPPQRTGEAGLMALEKEVYNQTAELQKRYGDQVSEASRIVRESIRLPGSVEDAQAFVGNRLERVIQALDARVKQAGIIANERIAALSPERKASEASMIVREEVEKALSAARTQEGELWDAVPDDVSVKTAALFDDFVNLRNSLPRAKRDQIPDKARRFLDRESNERLGDEDTVKEIYGLRSELLEIGRKARAEGDFEKARITRLLDESIMRVLGEAEGGEALTAARDFSRVLNERFTQGAVGRVLGKDGSGGDAVDPSLTLETTIGRGGQRGRVEGEQVLAGTNSGEADAATQDFLKARFAEQAFRQGEFNKSAADAFVRRNAEALEMFPDLKRQMTDANDAVALRDRIARTSGERADNLRNPNRTVAARFIDAEPEDAIARVLTARNATAAAQELRRLVAKDKTGKALDGLQSAFVDHLIRAARTPDVDDAGEMIVSGRRFWNLLNDTKTQRAMDAILDQAQMARLRKAADAFRNIETASRTPAAGEIMTDAPGKIIHFIMGTIGARAGAQLGEGTSGASLRTASKTADIFENMAERLSGDRAAMMIEDAILRDPDLLRALLLDMRDPDAKKAARRINAWLLDADREDR